MTGQANDIQWYIARDGKQHGPLTDVEMRTFVAHNYLRQSDLIWRPGMTEWQAAPVQFPAAFQGGGAQPPPRGVPAQGQQPLQGHSQAISASPQPFTHNSDFERPVAPRREGSVVRRLALASVAITVLGGGAFALATYHQPLMDMVSGSGGSAGEDTPVVTAPTDTVAQAEPAAQAEPTAQAEPVAPAADPPADQAAQPARASLGASDVMPTSGTAANEAQPTTTASVASDPPPAQPADAQPGVPPSNPNSTSSTSTADTPGAPDTAKDTQVAAIQPQAAPPAPPSIDGSPLDGRLQKVPVWELIKKEYPSWYTSEITAANKLVADNKPDGDVAMLLAQGLVTLRRQNANKALAASSEKLQAIAEAFLAHLKSLRAQSVSACFGFISKGETSPAVVQTMEHPETATALNAQADAIFQAISEGGKNPVKHDPAVKTDYDVLIKELGKLGWKEEDLQVFSNPKLLAKREPEQVCKMVQEWFVAHLAVQDKAIRDRLLFETLKPVVQG